MWVFEDLKKKKKCNSLLLFDADVTHSSFLRVCVSILSSSSPFAAAEEGARRPVRPAELAGTGRVCALHDERVQVRLRILLLRLGLRGRKGG